MSKADLHRIIDELPESKEEEALRLLEDLRDEPGFSVENAPYDDEPLSEDDIKALDEAQADIAAGRVISHAELTRELFGT